MGKAFRYLLNRPNMMDLTSKVTMGKLKIFYCVCVYILEHIHNNRELWKSVVEDITILDSGTSIVKEVLLPKQERYEEGCHISVQCFILHLINFGQENLALISL